jgi:hypothetical protein
MLNDETEKNISLEKKKKSNLEFAFYGVGPRFITSVMDFES